MNSNSDTNSWPFGLRRVPGLTLARALALAVIGAMVLGLILLHVSSRDSRVSVPKDARAGDLRLERCKYTTEDGSFPADCGTLVVPENRNNPQSRLIALPVKRIRATGSAPEEPIFRMEGGPGLSNMTFPQASRFLDRHDVVLVGYRGVDGSSVLDCPEVESALKHSRDFTAEDSMHRYTQGFNDCAARLTAAGVDLPGYSLPQRIDDMEAARKALGYATIDLLSESAGTRTALIYAWRYPESIHRSVMIGVNPPGHYVWDPEITDGLLGDYSALCSQDKDCSARTDDLAASMRRTAKNMPERWLFLPIKEGNVRASTLFGLFHTSDEVAPLNAKTTLDAWLSAAGGDASGFWLLSMMSGLIFPESFVWGEYAATGMIDGPAARAYYAAGGDPGSILGNSATDFVWGGGALPNAWPESPDNSQYIQLRSSDVETLMVSGDLDFSTPARFATDELLPYLPNGKQVILTGFGHSTDFWYVQRDAGTRLLASFYSDGQADASLYKPQPIDFDPGVASAPNIAKMLLGTMAGLIGLAVLLLAWMAARLALGGSFGRKTSFALRTLSPAILGLGSWFLAVTVMMVAWPAAFIGDELAAVLSIGIPIGLGVYLAWVSRDTAFAGLLAATGGGLTGAWLGFHTVDGILAVFTTLAGAGLGANFLLIVLDVTWDLYGRVDASAAVHATGRGGLQGAQ